MSVAVRRRCHAVIDTQGCCDASSLLSGELAAVMVIPMPGQRKRNRQAREGRQRASAALAAGWRWEVICETEDSDQLRARLRSLQDERPDTDPSRVRIDTLCGRLKHPTTYRLSVLVPQETNE